MGENIRGIELAWKLHFEFEELSYLAGSENYLKIESETEEIPEKAMKIIHEHGYGEVEEKYEKYDYENNPFRFSKQ